MLRDGLTLCGKDPAVQLRCRATAIILELDGVVDNDRIINADMRVDEYMGCSLCIKTEEVGMLPICDLDPCQKEDKT